MPELPEVETIRTGLAALLPGKAVSNVWHDWAKSFPNAEEDVKAFLIGARVIDVRRRAKVLIIDLSSAYSLVIHLKMTGQMVYKSQNEHFGAGHPTDSLIGQLPDKSTRVIFCLSEKEAPPDLNARKQRSAEENVQKAHGMNTEAVGTVIDQERWQSFGLRPKATRCDVHLFFNDQRKFGWVRLIPTAEIPNIDFMRKVGPEPLSTEFTPSIFIERVRRRKNSNIKAVLLDQTVIAGIGNIYADESLWAAKIHPLTLVKDLSEQNLQVLYKEIRDVLRLSIEKGGSSDRNYVDAAGRKGSYLNFANVFRREGQPCNRCGTIIIKTRVAGRGTHICPNCQKEIKR